MNDDAIATSADLNTALRKMVAVLQDERQALAGLDLDGIVGCGYDKCELVDRLDGTAPALVDAEARGLLMAARQMNEVNRQMRNLIAANVAARLDALTGGAPVYRPASARGPALYAYAGRR